MSTILNQETINKFLYHNNIIIKNIVDKLKVDFCHENNDQQEVKNTNISKVLCLKDLDPVNYHNIIYNDLKRDIEMTFFNVRLFDIIVEYIEIQEKNHNFYLIINLWILREKNYYEKDIIKKKHHIENLQFQNALIAEKEFSNPDEIHYFYKCNKNVKLKDLLNWFNELNEHVRNYEIFDNTNITREDILDNIKNIDDKVILYKLLANKKLTMEDKLNYLYKLSSDQQLLILNNI